MATKCLLLETRDKKKFFTLVGNFKHLKEYCKAFGAKMFVVKAEIERNKVLDLQKLVPALCDKNYTGEKVDYAVLESRKIK
jgi:hypothetical protein